MTTEKKIRIRLPRQAPGVLIYCPNCCQQTSCVTTHLHVGDKKWVINQCQVCGCEFPDQYNFENMDPATALDYVLLTVIITMVHSKRKYACLDFNQGDVLMVVQCLVYSRFSPTWYQDVLDRATFLQLTSPDLENSLYPSVLRKLTKEHQRKILSTLQSTAPQQLIEKVARLLRESAETKSPLQVAEQMVDGCHSLLLQGCQQLKMDKWLGAG